MNLLIILFSFIIHEYFFLYLIRLLHDLSVHYSNTYQWFFKINFLIVTTDYKTKSPAAFLYGFCSIIANRQSDSWRRLSFFSFWVWLKCNNICRRRPKKNESHIYYTTLTRRIMCVWNFPLDQKNYHKIILSKMDVEVPSISTLRSIPD